LPPQSSLAASSKPYTLFLKGEQAAHQRCRKGIDAMQEEWCLALGVESFRFGRRVGGFCHCFLGQWGDAAPVTRRHAGSSIDNAKATGNVR
jgi:hypothetical protein